MSYLLALLLLFQTSPTSTPLPELAKFTAFTVGGPPTIIQLDIGTSAHCTIWAGLKGQWANEVACYTLAGSVAKLELIQVQADDTTGMYGSFAYTGGSFTWSIVRGAWSFQACPLNGFSLVKSGMFP